MQQFQTFFNTFKQLLEILNYCSFNPQHVLGTAVLERWFLFVILSGQVWKNKCERNCIYWDEIFQRGIECLLEDYKYNSNSSEHHALAGSLQFLEHTIAVSALISVVGSLTGYSWDSPLSSDICQYYFCCVLIKFSHLFESLTVLLGQL